ncbi:probable tyrosyl-DNA phosphodiesterase [Aphidius gifuensis]|uniref:probable tyrosyl-DNA phosphodiesterase n=1 Tax=Aphidius gifuensis TaxID=684658 RepID=UPI001CDB4CBE|nr:probable tyrosyl-DNA phosphodiesterase [Aphidius gifuensis]
MDSINQRRGQIIRHKPLCQKKEHCYIGIESHLSNFSHPHLEDVLEGQLDVENPVLPPDVEFPWGYTIVTSQIKKLQKILRKERDSSSSSPSVVCIDLTLDDSEDDSDDKKKNKTSKKRLPNPKSVQESKNKYESSAKRSRQDVQSSNNSVRQQLQQDKYQQPSTSSRVQNYNAQKSPSVRELLQMNSKQYDDLQSIKLNNYQANGLRTHKKTSSACQPKNLYKQNNYDEQKKTFNSKNSCGNNLPVSQSLQPSRSINQNNLQPSSLTATSRQNNTDQQLYKKKLNYQQDSGTKKSSQQSTSSHDNSQASTSSTTTTTTTTTAERPRVKRTQQQYIKERKTLIKKLNDQGAGCVIKPPGEFDIKYIMSAPYNVFLSTVVDEPKTWDQPYSITFPEILDISLGKIVKSLHISYIVHVGWLHIQYLLAMQPVDCTIICEERIDDIPLDSNTKVFIHKTTTKYGCHHSKISILQYENGARIIISTANLYLDDWQNRTQAIWISPHLPYLTDGADSQLGESRTGFKRDFLEYIKAYKRDCLKEWLELLKKLNFAAINVFFVGSVPGSHKDDNKTKWGVQKLSKLLSQHAELPKDGAKWSIVGQSSSIGNLGENYGSWIGPNFVSLLAESTDKSIQTAPRFEFIYPAEWDYKKSFDVRHRCCCLTYPKILFKKQMWLLSNLRKWKSDDKCRTRAMPHVKSYTRISPDGTKVPWIAITSANLSRAAWGYGTNANIILSYEAGIVFFPKFVTGQTTFPIKNNDSSDVRAFPIPYDVPLTDHDFNEDVFVTDMLNK